jgi:2Fe-2S ferredoxin
MPKIKFIQASGEQQVVEAPVGTTVMQAAIDHLVPGIVADCGGACSCATCHGFIAAPWRKQVPPADDTEQAMLQCASELDETSRLTCQVFITQELDGLVVRLPASQG